MTCNIIYHTCRVDPKFEWFISSLRRECKNDFTGIRLIVVSAALWETGDSSYFTRQLDGVKSFVVTVPKPSIWQGPNRLTKQNFFAASNSRNTGLCLCEDGHAIYADDLSVLMPGWLNAVREAMAGGYICLGAYKKVKNLVVEDGLVRSCWEYPAGLDSRWNYGSDTGPVACGGDMLYGCSVAMPVEALLTINGWPEYVDSLGGEDSCCGVALRNAGFQFKYDRRMLTLESEELHHVGPVFRKEDWHFENGKPVVGGNGADDCSHAALNIALQSKYFPQYLGDGFDDMRALRQHVLNGGAFPVRNHPIHHWYTKQLLSEL